MHLHRFIVSKLRVLKERDDRFSFWNGDPMDALCLRGLNGSGKTTYLEAIAALWELFGQWSQTEVYDPLPDDHLLNGVDLCALHIGDLPPESPAPSLWLVYGRRSRWLAVTREDQDLVVGMLFNDKVGRPALLASEHHERLFRYFGDGLKALLRPALAMKTPPALPNMILLGAEDRVLRPLSGDLRKPAVEPAYQWLARYQPTDRQAGHIENQMVEIRDVNYEAYLRLGEEMLEILPGIRLHKDLDRQSRRPLFRIPSSVNLVTLDRLSAGERAAIISFVFLQRWLAPGGVVLVDEPELHQHAPLMRQNLAALERYIVKEKQGQMLVASHAAEVWHYFRKEAVVELSVLEPA